MTRSIIILLTGYFLFNGTILEGEPIMEKATFAGGCFWCMEQPFEELDGVFNVVSGYTGGTTKNPTNEEVSSGTTGNEEAIQAEKKQILEKYKKKGVLKRLLGIAKEKGVSEAVAIAKKMNDPFVLDILHDILVQEGFYNKFKK